MRRRAHNGQEVIDRKSYPARRTSAKFRESGPSGRPRRMAAPGASSPFPTAKGEL